MKYVPLYNALGVFLPLITVTAPFLGGTCCAIRRDDYNLAESTVYSFGSGLSWALSLLRTAACENVAT
jgi:Na+-transporting NADH:ubiquinone oxidoreductase subunit E